MHAASEQIDDGEADAPQSGGAQEKPGPLDRGVLGGAAPPLGRDPRQDAALRRHPLRLHGHDLGRGRLSGQPARDPLGARGLLLRLRRDRRLRPARDDLRPPRGLGRADDRASRCRSTPTRPTRSSSPACTLPPSALPSAARRVVDRLFGNVAWFLGSFTVTLVYLALSSLELALAIETAPPPARPAAPRRPRSPPAERATRHRPPRLTRIPGRLALPAAPA